MEAARCAAKSSSENLSAASSPNFDVDFFRFRIFSISVGDSDFGVDVKTPTPTPPTSTISSKDFDADAEDFDAVDFKIPFLGGNEVGRGVGGVKHAFAGGDQSGGANLDGVDGGVGGALLTNGHAPPGMLASTGDMEALSAEIEMERMEYVEKSRHLSEQLQVRIMMITSDKDGDDMDNDDGDIDEMMAMMMMEESIGYG